MKSEAEQQLADALKAVTVAMRRMRGRETRRHDGLSYAQYGLLFALEEGGCSRSARDLGEAASLSPASVTQMLEGLEANGLVARTRSDQDRRVVLTELTDPGRTAILEMRTRMEPAWRAALSEFSEDQLHSAAAVLQSLADYFRRMADEPGAAVADSDAVGAGRDGIA